jgi:hypothetical protein
VVAAPIRVLGTSYVSCHPHSTILAYRSVSLRRRARLTTPVLGAPVLGVSACSAQWLVLGQPHTDTARRVATLVISAPTTPRTMPVEPTAARSTLRSTPAARRASPFHTAHVILPG